MTETIAELKFKLMQANTLIESRDEEIKTLALEVTQLRNDAKLSDMAWKDNQAALKAQAETIARLTAKLAQCKHALDDEGDDDDLGAAMCKCGHPLRGHRDGECIEQQSDGYICECNDFEEAK